MKKNTLMVIILFLSSLMIAAPVYAQFDFLKKKFGDIVKEPSETIKQTALSDTEIGQGLKEALKVGINNTVSSVGKAGGYFNNENIRIPFPQKLAVMDSLLRKIGMGSMVDNFVLSMNQAAEAAAPSARDIFLDALLEMNFEDVQKIYQGKENAATTYFKDKTYTKLADEFRPQVDKALAAYDVTNKHNTLLDQYKTIPFASTANLISPDEYVVQKALNGLFFVLGQEEAKIRQDPAARVTDILQKVFK
jgi:hypothetical protein